MRPTRRGWLALGAASCLAGVAVGLLWPQPTPQPAQEPAVPAVLLQDSQGQLWLYDLPPERGVAKVARSADRTPPQPTRQPKQPTCQDHLAQVLHAAGFRGANLREAWAIAMRESNGQNLGPGHWAFNGEDWGIFQLNQPSWGSQPWWDSQRLLDPAYSASVAYTLSDGGNDWHPWGLTGDGKLDASSYGAWSAQQVWAWIMEPYQRYYSAYPCAGTL